LTTTVRQLSEVVDAFTDLLPEISARAEEFEKDRMSPADLVARLSVSGAFECTPRRSGPVPRLRARSLCSAVSRVDPDSGVGSIHPKENL
jgi:hypothetical protein